MAEALVRLRDVQFGYDPLVPVLQDASLEVLPGEMVGMLGSNGAGKTTLLRLIAGLLEPQMGTIDPRRRGRPLTDLGYLPHEDLTYRSLSAWENLSMFGALWGLSQETTRARSEALLREAHLWSLRNRWSESLSEGQRKRLRFCLAMLHRPRLLLLDEPFASLDLEAHEWMRDRVADHLQKGGGVLLTTHTAEVLDALAHRLIIVADGRLVADYSAHQVQELGGARAAWRSRSRSSPS